MDTNKYKLTHCHTDTVKITHHKIQYTHTHSTTTYEKHTTTPNYHSCELHIYKHVQAHHVWGGGAAFSPLANSPPAISPAAKTPRPAAIRPLPPSYANYILTYHYHRCCVARSPLTFEVVDSSVIVHIS